jgi:hypothetical protein|tara:strand:+ start:1065 stop:1565 length:501 start_codon:yes stop_codon:yes gene_type:complete
MKIIYSDNSFYEGEMKNNKKNGQGYAEFPSGNIYQGEWKNNNVHGFGKVIYANKYGVYQGNWKNNKKHGYGKMVWTSTLYSKKHTYIGYWENDKMCGKGKYIIEPQRYIYVGEFKNGVEHGYGILYANDYSFEGIWNNGHLGEKTVKYYRRSRRLMNKNHHSNTLK